MAKLEFELIFKYVQQMTMMCFFVLFQFFVRFFN